MDMWNAIADERRALVRDLKNLTEDDWKAPTVCAPWDVKAVVAHVVLPFEVSKPTFMFNVLRNGRDVPKTIRLLSARVNQAMTRQELVASLEKNANSKWKPPRVGPEVPLGEIVVHGQDIRRAIGMQREVPPDIASALLAAIDDSTIRADYQARILLGRAVS